MLNLWMHGTNLRIPRPQNDFSRSPKVCAILLAVHIYDTSLLLDILIIYRVPVIDHVPG